MTSMVRIEAALVTRPNEDEPSDVESPEKLGVFERFWTSQRRSKWWRSCGPKRNDFASEAFQLNLQGPSIAPRRSSPKAVGAGVAKAAVLKNASGEPPQIPSLGLPTGSARSEKLAPVPLSDARPPR